ncbi:helix-turn-helix transcriptional regulator [Ruficoccus sp. ZRK36]|uniref:helix-turn-helix domain-containing protein n=1 Tax=Ruficoccus sp. ZRK36 TaxID=2866311 RepID=UPI001C7363F9|nr:helix-turn-helix transcriptional regulator [Ruficoccus sp. ZRK36]QYY34802.1 helix-turn-helix domain-containing protein [Ruficoccus sp. ZRK36]QYY37296.1 helix-turn-helix domain-containing protein [Ruficoccus sp. ZRK36]
MKKQPFSIRERLLELRQTTALYQEETAELLDLPYKTYQAIEGGRRTAIRLDTLEKIAEGYEIDLWQLFHPNLPKLNNSCEKRVIKLMKHRGIPRR